MVQNKKEKALMEVVYTAARPSGGQCLITPLELLNRIPYKVEFRENDLEPVMEALSLDGYFEYESATRKGEPVFCIILKEKGNSYMRDKRNARIKIYKRIATTIAFALLGYLVKVVISAII